MMPCVAIEVRKGAATRRVGITASSIERALKMAGEGTSGRSVRLLFLIGPESFFVREGTGRREAAWAGSVTTGKGGGDELYVGQGVQQASYHLPVLRGGTAPADRSRLGALRLLRFAPARLCAPDLERHSRAARRRGRPPLRVRTSRDAQAARRGAALPGLPLGGLACRSQGPGPTEKGGRWLAT